MNATTFLSPTNIWPAADTYRSFPLTRRTRRLARASLLSCSGIWQEVQDPGSGRPYYWNTSTNETTWEKPEALTADEAGLHPPSRTSPPESAEVGQATALTQPQILDSLQQAYKADNTGMQFWEAARLHRKDGVFESGFSDYLAHQIAAAPDSAAREALLKLQARLSNPLLKQPAPFEF